MGLLSILLNCNSSYWIYKSGIQRHAYTANQLGHRVGNFIAVGVSQITHLGHQSAAHYDAVGEVGDGSGGLRVLNAKTYAYGYIGEVAELGQFGAHRSEERRVGETC